MNYPFRNTRIEIPGLQLAAGMFVAIAIMLFSIHPAGAGEDTEAGPEGLVSIAGTKFDSFFLKAGINLGAYNKVMIEEPAVSMIAHWRRDHRDTVTKRDEEKIKTGTAARLKDELVKKLSENNGFTVVEEQGEGVLLLKPAIVNMNIYAPDTGAAGRRVSLVHSAGHATLELEIYDSASGELLAKARDHRNSDRWGGTHLYRANRATNNREFRQIMSVWGERLREQLQRSG